MEEMDLDLHLGLPYGGGLSSASAGTVGEAAFAGGRRGATPSRAASSARAAMASRSGWRGAPAGTAARPYRASRPTNAAPTVAGGPPVGGRGGVGGVLPRRGSGGVEELDLDLHLRLPYGERLSSASAGAVGEADFAGGRRGAAPSRAASTARAAMATRTGWRRAPAGTAARPYRAPRPANAAPVGGRGAVGGGAGLAAGGQYADDGALGQEPQGRAEWRKLKNGPPECLDNLEVMFEHTAADASSCVLGQHISNEGDDRGDESEDWGEESDDDGDCESYEDGDDESEMIVKAMNKFISENARIQFERNEMLRKHFEMKHEMAQQVKCRHEKIWLVHQLARECGVQETNMQLRFAVHKITKDDDGMEFFIGTSTPEGRLAFIEQYAGDKQPAMDVDTSDESSDESSDEEIWSLALDNDGEIWRLALDNDLEIWRLALDDDDSIFLAGMMLYAIYLDKYCNSDDDDGDCESHEDRDDESEMIVKAMIRFMSENARIQSERNEILQKHLEMKHEMAQLKVNCRHEKIRLVQQLARECGVQETNRQLWFAVHRITKDDDIMEFFIGTSTPEGRMTFIEQCAARAGQHKM